MATEEARWRTPFLKQLFVTAGASINLGQFGLMTGYAVAIIPHLKRPGAEIPLDDETGSWIASVQGIPITFGIAITAFVMAKYGRYVANLISSVAGLIGWLWILLANSITDLLIARILQGISLGFCGALCPVYIAEVASPRYRGMFLVTSTIAMSVGNLLTHSVSFFLHWRTSALICSIITFVDVIIFIYSPETPTWLAEQGRYEDSKRVFRWLRGDNEEAELNRLIEASIEARESSDINKPIKDKITDIIKIVKKKEVYKPIIVGLHLMIVAYWSGLNTLSCYVNDIVFGVTNSDVNMPLIVVLLSVVRLITVSVALYFYKRFRRRLMVICTIGFNSFILISISGYFYAKDRNMLPFNSPVVGILLINLLMLSVAGGALPVGIIISGEIFPMKYRSFASGLTGAIGYFNLFLAIKTFPVLVKNVNFHGAFLLYGILCTYGLIVTLVFLPETKNKTLQEIEQVFKGKSANPVDKTTELFLKDMDT